MDKASVDRLKEAVSILTRLSRGQHRVDRLFRDFVWMATISIQNKVEPQDAAWHEREAEWTKMSAAYGPDVVTGFAQVLAIITIGYATVPSDWLGEIFTRLELGRKHTGQFFTPYHVSELMAGLSIDKATVEKAIAAKGYIAMNEPSCGAGGMIVAVAEMLRHMGYKPEQHLRVIAQDIDLHCVQMAYLASTLSGIPAVIIHGNTLALEERSALITGQWVAAEDANVSTQTLAA